MKLFTPGRYATIASTAALVVALGGTSYAAGMITGADIKNGTVTTADIKDHSLKVRDLSAGAQTTGYTTHDNGPTDLVTGTDLKVLSLTLNAGSYVVHANTTAEHEAPTPSNVSCYVSYAGGPGDTASVTLADAIPTTSDASLDTQLAFKISARTEIDFRCNQDAGTNSVKQSWMTAVKVANTVLR